MLVLIPLEEHYKYNFNLMKHTYVLYTFSFSLMYMLNVMATIASR